MMHNWRDLRFFCTMMSRCPKLERVSLYSATRPSLEALVGAKKFSPFDDFDNGLVLKPENVRQLGLILFSALIFDRRLKQIRCKSLNWAFLCQSPNVIHHFQTACSHLTSLELCFTADSNLKYFSGTPPLQSYDGGALCRFLAGCPKLERLGIKFYFRGTRTDPMGNLCCGQMRWMIPPAETANPWPNLKSLSLGGFNGALTELLAILKPVASSVRKLTLKPIQLSMTSVQDMRRLCRTTLPDLWGGRSSNYVEYIVIKDRLLPYFCLTTSPVDGKPQSRDERLLKMDIMLRWDDDGLLQADPVDLYDPYYNAEPDGGGHCSSIDWLPHSF